MEERMDPRLVKAIRNAQKRYTPTQLVHIDGKIRELSDNHVYYGKHLPLCIGKVRGVQGVLNTFYGIELEFAYVWDVIESYINEPKE